ncbi:MAG: glycosyltransferase family 2 protein [Candidatus Omnitrophota bacterium]
MSSESGKKESICAVVVTYNRKHLLLECLNALLKQTYPLDAVYLIDNASTDGTPELLQEKGFISEILNTENGALESQKTISALSENTINKKLIIHYVRMHENTGGAGGFYEGVKRGYERGYDWLWLMDDDAIADYDSLSEIIKVGVNNNYYCYFSNCNNDSEFTGQTKEVSNWLFVGAFISSNAIKTVGFPRGDFFIYHDDGEYATRIIQNAFKILKVRDSRINHKDSPNNKFMNKQILWKKLRYPLLQDWKLYYFIRNDLLKETGIRRFSKVYKNIKEGFMLLVLNPRQLPVFIIAFFHGVFGKSGKFPIS